MNSEKVFQVQYDLCVIGSGPAGLIVALEFSRLNPDKNVLLIEYGTTKQTRKNKLDDSIQIKNPVNHHIPSECTNKGLGGSSASWGGRCVMFDEVDFTARPLIGNNCTWDLELFHELQNYLLHASAYFECGKPAFNLEELPEFRHIRIAEGFEEGPVTDTWLERWSKPTRLGARYAKELRERSNISVIQGYEARTFSPPDKEGFISKLLVREVTTEEWHEILANVFVLAAGTQENTRILLRNKQVFSRLPAVPAALGKYYQGHVSGKIASVKFKGDPKKTDYGFLRDEDGIYLRRRFQFSASILREENLLNTAIWLDNPLYYQPEHRSGAMSFMYLAMLMPVLGKKLAPPAIAHSITKGKVHGIEKHIFNILKDLPASLVTPAVIFFKRYCLDRKLPGVSLYSPKNYYALHFHAEQVPHEANRMELGSDGETLEIYYTLQDADVHSVIRLHNILDNWLRKCACGELEYWFPLNELPESIRNMSRDGIHQSGTTRIGNSPETGVVDRDLKVWGTSNLFVCSSSVFPTSGQANPTFLLGAFSARLSEYLSK